MKNEISEAVTLTINQSIATGILPDKLKIHLNWESHINKIANTIIKTIVILNKLKHVLPLISLSIMYHSLILPHINHGILVWGHQAHRIYTPKESNKIITLTLTQIPFTWNLNFSSLTTYTNSNNSNFISN